MRDYKKEVVEIGVRLAQADAQIVELGRINAETSKRIIQRDEEIRFHREAIRALENANWHLRKKVAAFAKVSTALKAALHQMSGGDWEMGFVHPVDDPPVNSVNWPNGEKNGAIT